MNELFPETGTEVVAKGSIDRTWVGIRGSAVICAVCVGADSRTFDGSENFSKVESSRIGDSGADVAGDVNGSEIESSSDGELSVDEDVSRVDLVSMTFLFFGTLNFLVNFCPSTSSAATHFCGQYIYSPLSFVAILCLDVSFLASLTSGAGSLLPFQPE